MAGTSGLYLFSPVSVPQDLDDLGFENSSHVEVIQLLVLVHPAWSKYVVYWIFLQKVVDQHPANFIVVSLLLLWVNFALGLVELRDQRQGAFVDVVGDFVLEQGLVKVEPPDTELAVSGRVLLENPPHHKHRLWTLLDVRKYLIDLVWNYVPVLVLPHLALESPLLLERLVLLLVRLFVFFNFYCFYGLILCFSTLFEQRFSFLLCALLLESPSSIVKDVLGLKCSGGFFRL